MRFWICFWRFIQDEEHSVLISSHITSDLEKVADYITFIHRGEVFMSEEKDRIMEEYAVIHCRSEDVEQMDKKYIAGIQRGTYGCDVLVNNRTAVRPEISGSADGCGETGRHSDV